MAGINPERVTRIKPVRTRRPDEACDDAPVDVAPLADLALPSLKDLMARVGAELLRQRWRSPPAAQRPLASRPQLVADNSGPEQQLSRIVELEIIPRLMLLHGGATRSPEPAGARFAITAAHVETLVHLAADGDANRPEQFVTALIAAGAPLADIYLQLLTPAARMMGQLWMDDVYSFSQVTVGLWRLQQVLHEQGRQFIDQSVKANGLRTLLAPTPGSQHTFGVAMLGEFFARDGWEVRYEPQTEWQKLQALVEDEWFDMLGLSVSLDSSVTSVASAILTLRKVSRNKNLFVMVGGPCALTVPDLLQRSGADALAADATTALLAANRWLGSAHRAH